MNTATPGSVGHLVIAEVVHGQEAPHIYGEKLHADVSCAALEAHDLAMAIAQQGHGVALGVRRQGVPLGVAVTEDGDVWVVRAHLVGTLAAASTWT